MLIQLDCPKIIGDPIHGYIPLTKLEYDLLQLPVMNRLHYIRQTAMGFIVFPGSVTTRFAHVVGALQIGGKMISQLLSTLPEQDFKVLFPDLTSSPEPLVKAVRLACLFHDIGHGPFSHSTEEVMTKVTKKYYPADIELAKKLFNEKNEDKIPIHEFFSYKLITNGSIKDTILDNERGSEGKQLIDAASQLLIKTEDSRLIKNNPGFLIIRKLVSSQLDADRMDYLLRDSTMSGVKYGLVDVDRIIKNMAIVKTLDNTYELAIHERAIGAIEEMLDARFKMYRWFYNHHTIVVTNELLKLAVSKLVEKNKKIALLFHWSQFEKGYSTDDYVLSMLLERIDQASYQVAKGLVDRRYLPVSLFKSTPDFGRLIVEVSRRSGKKEDPKIVTEKIVQFFKHKASELLEKRLGKMGGNLAKCKIYQTNVQMKPYEPFSNKDRVYLYRTHENELCELLSESPYFNKVNDVWKSFRGSYIFYLIPGEQRQKFGEYKPKILEVIADEIAKT